MANESKPEEKKDETRLTVKDLDRIVALEDVMRRVANLENEVEKLKKKK